MTDPVNSTAALPRAFLASEPLLTEAEAAAFLRVSRRTLQRYRQFGGGPAFRRVGTRRLVYARSDLIAWIDERRHNHEEHQS